MNKANNFHRVAESLHKITGTEQRIISAYYLHLNGLCEECQNLTIKDSLIKLLEEFSLIQKSIRS